METVDLKLVLLGASRRTHPRPALAWRGAPAVRVAPRASGCSGSLHAVRSCAVGSPHPPPALMPLLCAGQPGVGKTCLVYRYLYNTFGETISARPRLPPRLTPAAARAAPRHTGPADPVTVTRLPPACHPPATWQTIGASFAMKKVEANGRTCNLGIWDTAGQERASTVAARALLY